MRADLPTGTVTFLFTDVEGSTKLLRELGAEAYADALAEHRRVVREACGAEGGVEVDTQGDAFFFAFPSASGAAAAAQAMTEAFAPGRIHLRIGLHTGTPVVTEEGYVGDDVHLAARIAASGYGGQVVLSQATGALLDDPTLTDLGEHRLKDIEGAVAIIQLGAMSFPPLKTISNTNLPRPASTFVGRTAELAEVISLVADGSRLVTLTGPGGSGKTRLAIEAAATLVPSYKAATFWVGLASLRDPALVTATISQTIGSTNGLAEHIGEREMLLLLDNLEQVIEVAPEVSALLSACPNLTLLVTSRELLRVQGEVEYEVPPLASPEAVSLFCARSRLEPSEEIAELCARLDNLPLALELAAARAKALSPRQILERLAERLDLLRGGRDADPRQQTLRATIEWSYGLLSDDEQRLFRALSVFSGGCTLEAAQAVADADLDSMQSLVEKSLLRFSNERYWLLETIREFARERLTAVTDDAERRDRHARHYLCRLEETEREVRGRRHQQCLAWYAAEEDNLRTMLDSLTEFASVEAARAAYLLVAFWGGRGAFSEARDRYKRLLTDSDLPDESRAMLLERLADVEERLGDLDAADAAVREALTLAESTGAQPVLADALRISAWVASRRDDSDQAIHLARCAVEEAASLDPERRIHALHDLGSILADSGHHEEARVVLRRSAEEARSAGHVLSEVSTAVNLGFVELHERDFEQAQATLASALEQNRKVSHYTSGVFGLMGLGHALLGLERHREARIVFAEMLELILAGRRPVILDLTFAVSGIALAAERVNFANAARIRGAVEQLRRGVEFSSEDDDLERLFEQTLADTLGDKAYAREKVIGAAMSLDETVELARSLAGS